MNKKILLQWISEAGKLKKDESIFIPCDSRASAVDLQVKFKKEIEHLTEINALKSDKLRAILTIKDQRFWVELKKVYGSPLVGFKKTIKGVERVEVNDPERQRRILCMKEDGMNIDEVMEIEGELTEKEKEIFS